MRLLVAGVLAGAALVGCSGGSGQVEGLDQAQKFDRHPLYWVGERFEEWELEHVDIGNGEIVSFIYGDCETSPAGGCAPPLQIQVRPLCRHLETAHRNQIWRTRRVRGAPVGTEDSAPVLYANRVQVKVYRGQGSTPGVELRALEALRSANDVKPVLGPDDPIPPSPADVLAGTAARCPG